MFRAPPYLLPFTKGCESARINRGNYQCFSCGQRKARHEAHTHCSKSPQPTNAVRGARGVSCLGSSRQAGSSDSGDILEHGIIYVFETGCTAAASQPAATLKVFSRTVLFGSSFTCTASNGTRLPDLSRTFARRRRSPRVYP